MQENIEEIVILVQRAKSGDQDSFAKLYDLFADRIYKYIRIRVAETAAAEDILQEVFLKAWNGCKKLESDGLHFSAWLYKITERTVKDHYRKTYSRPQTVELESEVDIAVPDDTPRLTEQAFIGKEVQAAISRLPAHYRLVIELRFFQQFSLEETAKIMGKPSLSIRVMQHRAIKKLEQIYKKLWKIT